MTGPRLAPFPVYLIFLFLVFDVVIILTILINCVFLALDDPVDELEYVFTAIYTLEVVIKVTHRSLILNFNNNIALHFRSLRKDLY